MKCFSFNIRIRDFTSVWKFRMTFRFFEIFSLSLLFVLSACSNWDDTGEDVKEVKIGVLLPMTSYWPIGKTRGVCHYHCSGQNQQ